MPLPIAGTLQGLWGAFRESIQWHKAKLIKKHDEKKLIRYLLSRFLYQVCSPAAAMKGFFSIPSLFTSLIAISIFSWLSAIPPIFISSLVVLNVVFCLRVEQPIFFKPFRTLIKQALGYKTKPNFNTQTIDLRTRIKTLLDDHANLKTSHTEILTKHPEFLPKDNIKNNTVFNKATSLISALTYYPRLILGYAVAYFIVSLRAMESSGRNMLGIVSFFALITPTPVTSLSYLFLAVSLVGYAINNSQFIVQQIHETLKKLGFKRFIKDDYLNHLKLLKQLVKPVKDKTPSSPKAKKTEQAHDWRYPIYLLCKAGFWLGAVGLSMTAFFSFKILGASSPQITFALAAIISVYILLVEQKILSSYVDGLVRNALGLNDKKTKATKTLDERIERRQQKILALESFLLTIWIAQKEVNDLKATFNKPNKSPKIVLTPIDRSVTPNYSLIRKILAYTGTYGILILRGLTSIGPPALGLDIAITGCIVALSSTLGFSVAFLGPWTFFPCLLVSTLGYIIKCSRNITDQFYDTLEKMFFLANPQNTKYKKGLLDNLDKYYIELLALYFERENAPCEFEFSDIEQAREPVPNEALSTKQTCAVKYKADVQQRRDVQNNNPPDGIYTPMSP